MNLPLPEDLFIDFLISAKVHTYASQGGRTNAPSLLPGSHQLEYRRGEMLYLDIYFGGDFFVGQETVFFQDRAIWCMGYAGGVLDKEAAGLATEDLYSCLRHALLQVQAARPYRGPRLYQEGAFTYQDQSQGSFERFSGQETISFQGSTVFELHYHGGLIRD